MLFPSDKTSRQRKASQAIRYSDFNYYSSNRSAPRPATSSKPASQPTTRKHISRPPINVFVSLIVVGLCVFAGVKYVESSSAASSHPDITSSVIKPYDDVTSTSVVVNKSRPLSNRDYSPKSLVTPDVKLRLDPTAEEMKVSSVIATPLQSMFKSAQDSSLSLMLSSGYRSATTQKQLYNYYVSVQGKATADEQSARPAYSEHQTGLAVDLAPTSGECDAQICFGNLPEGQWLRDNAYKSGFIIRYPADKTAVTGYSYEPWHLRYIGTDLAAKLHAKGIATLEEYYDISGGSIYH